MERTAKLDVLLGNVGLLRGMFSGIMQRIFKHQKSYQKLYRYPPPEVNALLIKAQDHFTEILKASDILVTARENIKVSKSTEADFDVYIEDWAISQAGAKLEPIISFLKELSLFSVDGFGFDAAFCKEGMDLVIDARGRQELI